MQRELGVPSPSKGVTLRFRIGIHLGDVLVDEGDLLGEGVNLAARLQSMVEPGGIMISQQVHDQVHSKLSIGFEYLGERRPKNFSEDVSVYRVSLDEKQRRKARVHTRPVHPERQNAIYRHLADLRERVIGHAKYLGTIWATLVIIDLVTGAPFWAHWPGGRVGGTSGAEGRAIVQSRLVQTPVRPLCCGRRRASFGKRLHLVRLSLGYVARRRSGRYRTCSANARQVAMKHHPTLVGPH